MKVLSKDATLGDDGRIQVIAQLRPGKRRRKRRSASFTVAGCSDPGKLSQLLQLMIRKAHHDGVDIDDLISHYRRELEHANGH